MISAVTLGLFATFGALSAPSFAHAQANVASESRYAAIVIDAASGEVLYAKRADSPRYPASITKVMTLYLVFEAMAQGKLKLTDEITFSRNAASKQPTKLGIPAGKSITVDEAIQALAIQSANDVATAVAEHLGGTESRFAAMMTLRAQELGMSQTRFVNASGLPDSRQLSSAQDIAILSRSMMRDYPQYYGYLGQKTFNYAGRRMNNHNGLLHRMPGVDGLKTGFTSASGYNLAASAVQGDRRLIAVVLGGRSNATRDNEVERLLNVGFDVIRRRDAGEVITVAQNLFEPREYERVPQDSFQLAAVDESEGEDAGIGDAEEPVANSPVPNPPARAAREPARPATGRYIVQVGAFKSKNDAQSQLRQMAQRFKAHFDDAASRVGSRTNGFYRAQFTGLTAEAARAACATLKAKRQVCMVIEP